MFSAVFYSGKSRKCGNGCSDQRYHTGFVYLQGSCSSSDVVFFKQDHDYFKRKELSDIDSMKQVDWKSVFQRLIAVSSCENSQK
jgi:hypothetical protein